MGAMLVAWELSPLFSSYRRPFGRLSPAERQAYLETCLRDCRGPRRALALWLKSLCLMAYCSHPRVEEAIGFTGSCVDEGPPRDVPRLEPIAYPHIRGRVEERADVCVVGSGAGGAVVAKELAEGGLSVIVLEEGAYFRRADFQCSPWERMQRLYRNRGLTAAFGRSVVPIPLGKCVGGTTVVNSGTCFARRAGAASVGGRGHRGRRPRGHGAHLPARGGGALGAAGALGDHRAERAHLPARRRGAGAARPAHPARHPWLSRLRCVRLRLPQRRQAGDAHIVFAEGGRPWGEGLRWLPRRPHPGGRRSSGGRRGGHSRPGDGAGAGAAAGAQPSGGAGGGGHPHAGAADAQRPHGRAGGPQPVHPPGHGCRRPLRRGGLRLARHHAVLLRGRPARVAGGCCWR
jgi:hypothetical protein